jgi:hypothetical protein
MTEQLRTTYEFKTKFEIKPPTFVKPNPYYRGPGIPSYPSDEELLAEIRTVISNQTMKIFQEEMIKQGVTDFKLLDLGVDAHITAQPYRESAGLFQPLKYYVEAAGLVTIEYEDNPLVLIGAILVALTAYLIAHPILIIAGLVFLAALAAVAIFNATVTNITQNTTDVIEALADATYKTTQTAGGTLVVLTAVIVVVIASAIAFVLVFPDAFSWLKRKSTVAYKRVRNWRPSY